ncbi:hypothetical protein C6N29_06720 [Flavobacterium columnare]|nr:hypothetical protein C6N29_06645 [Flavobacterium columnare]PTD14146.1 hypothetical protein C6N29_06720 [Flavobacterium columnare]
MQGVLRVEKATAKKQGATDAKSAKRSLRSFCSLADVVAPTSDGSERVKTGNEANKKRAAIFLGCSFLCLRVVCGTEAF